MFQVLCTADSATQPQNPCPSPAELLGVVLDEAPGCDGILNQLQGLGLTKRGHVVVLGI